MSAEILNFSTGGQIGDGVAIEPDNVLDGHKGELRSVVIVGLDRDGALVCAASHGRPDALALLMRATKRMVDGLDAD